MKIEIGNINYTYLNDRFYMYKKTEYDYHIPGDYRSWWLIERDCSCRPNLFRCVFTPFNPFEWGFFLQRFIHYTTVAVVPAANVFAVNAHLLLHVYSVLIHTT